jgi:Activator of Hsp90 ATPase homolog 1-like protein
MTEGTPNVVNRDVVVEAPVEVAFAMFTERFGDFKPPEHNLLGGPIAETVFEPRAGGHIYDRGVDGSECRWARVLVWDPPGRVVFSWDISRQWQIETDPRDTSEVEVRFLADTPQRTRVELEHRHIDRHGPGWESISDGVAGDDGWPRYLARYLALFPESGPSEGAPASARSPDRA